jgi:hypothetical protein
MQQFNEGTFFLEQLTPKPDPLSNLLDVFKSTRSPLSKMEIDYFLKFYESHTKEIEAKRIKNGYKK